MPDENLSSFNFTMFCFLSIIMSHNVRRIKNVDSCLRLAFFSSPLKVACALRDAHRRKNRLPKYWLP